MYIKPIKLFWLSNLVFFFFYYFAGWFYFKRDIIFIIKNFICVLFIWRDI